jgi:hypothetical protein
MHVLLNTAVRYLQNQGSGLISLPDFKSFFTERTEDKNNSFNNQIGFKL